MKRGYLASVLLAGVMVAGYLGMLPLLQSLAAEPAYPNDSPPAAAAASAAVAVKIPQQVVVPTASSKSVLVSTKPTKATSKKAKKHAAKAHTRTTPKDSPARATNVPQTHTSTHANTGGGTGGGSGQVVLGSGVPDSNASGDNSPVCNGLGC